MLSKFLKNWKSMLAVVVTLSTISGMVVAIDSRWAKAGEVKQISQRLDQKIYSDRVDRIQERMWRLEDRFGSVCEKMPIESREEYRKLRDEKAHLDEYLKNTK